MVITAPTLEREEVRQILAALAAKGHSIPEPQYVTVLATDDHEGDPVLLLTVAFSKRENPEELPWARVSPLVDALRQRVFAKGGEERPVIAKVRRLGEKRPKA